MKVILSGKSVDHPTRLEASIEVEARGETQIGEEDFYLIPKPKPQEVVHEKEDCDFNILNHCTYGDRHGEYICKGVCEHFELEPQSPKVSQSSELPPPVADSKPVEWVKLPSVIYVRGDNQAEVLTKIIQAIDQLQQEVSKLQEELQKMRER